jgi:hypothetical protein
MAKRCPGQEIYRVFNRIGEVSREVTLKGEKGIGSERVDGWFGRGAGVVREGKM